MADGHCARTWHLEGAVFCARNISEAAALFGLETSSPGGEAEGASRPVVRASVFLIMPGRVVQSGNYFDPSLPPFSGEAPLFPWDLRLALRPPPPAPRPVTFLVQLYWVCLSYQKIHHGQGTARHVLGNV